MEKQKIEYKGVQISPEYHRKLSIYAATIGKTKKKAFEDLIDTAIAKNKKQLTEERILCLN